MAGTENVAAGVAGDTGAGVGVIGVPIAGLSDGDLTPAKSTATARGTSSAATASARQYLR
jgi:hypothetical protein